MKSRPERPTKKRAARAPRRPAPRPDGERTRALVLDAALRVLAREGPRGVTHRAVAAAAGTSVRGTTYHFASRAELLQEAFARYAALAIERFDAITAAAPPPANLTPEQAAELLAATVLSDLTADRAGLIAEYELVLDVARGGAGEEAYAAWQGRLEGMLEGYARALGAAHPALHARVVLATLRGLELEALARPARPVAHADLTAVFRALLGATVRRG